MKHSNKLRKLAVPALAVGCLGNYSSSEAMQSYNDILKSKSCEQKLSCKLEVKVKVDFQKAQAVNLRCLMPRIILKKRKFLSQLKE